MVEPNRQVSEAALEYLLIELSKTTPATIESDIKRLDAIGYSVGAGIIEKCTMGKQRFQGEPMEIVKYICKEFWSVCFGKQIDHLKTNHRVPFALPRAHLYSQIPLFDGSEGFRVICRTISVFTWRCRQDSSVVLCSNYHLLAQ